MSISLEYIGNRSWTIIKENKEKIILTDEEIEEIIKKSVKEINKEGTEKQLVFKY